MDGEEDQAQLEQVANEGQQEDQMQPAEEHEQYASADHDQDQMEHQQTNEEALMQQEEMHQEMMQQPTGEEEQYDAQDEQYNQQQQQLELQQHEGEQQHYDENPAEMEGYGSQQFHDEEGQLIQGHNPGEYDHQFEGEMHGDDAEAMLQQQMQEHALQLQQLDPAQQMQMAIHEIEGMLKETGEQYYADPEFPPDDSSLYLDPLNPPEYAQEEPIVEWKRPQEIYMQDEPMMIVDGIEPADVKQGILGDCWFLGSFMLLGMNPNLLQNLIVYDGIKSGFAVFQFFKNGKWQYVLVDTRIPYSQARKTPLYAHSSKAQEFWVPLMEKAYAKLHGNYEVINGGSMSVGMVDVSGGVSEKFNLTTPEMQARIESGEFLKELIQYYHKGYLIGCSNSQKNEEGEQQEGAGQQGVRFNHAYGLERIEDVKEYHLTLVRIRNPWGSGAGSEWNGPFADEDEKWDEYKTLRDKLNYSFKNDGNWWMDWKDWLLNFNRVYVCKLFPSSWSQYSIPGEWKGNTAGGAYPVQADRDEEKADAHAKQDTNDRWFNNPQFRLTVTKKTQVIISLMQQDFNTGDKKPYIPVNFMLVRVKSRRDRLYEVDRDDIVLEAAEGGQRFAQREITKTVWLSPTHDKKNVHYIVVPNTEVEERKSVERPFYLRVFSSEPCELVQLPNTIEQEFRGKWDNNTNGGRRVADNGKENQFWCRNPQYFMNLTKPTHLKIILRKKGGKKFRIGNVGITVTKAHPPTTAPPSEIVGRGKKEKGMKLASSLAIQNAGMSYADTLKTTTKKEKGADKIPEFETPMLNQMERKLQILPNEWYQETYFQGDEYAALYAFYQPTQGPFIIVPSQTNMEIFPEFTLTVFSSQPVEIEKLEDSHNQVISGKWDGPSSGGCHLYDKEFEPTKPDLCSWVRNPKYLLRLSTRDQVEVKITLSRPEKAWKKSIGANLVGCMIGFYVYPGGQSPNQDNIRNKENIQFVPWNEISEIMLLDGAPDGYIIMPATYESGRTGPFIVSVATDCDFELMPYEQ